MGHLAVCRQSGLNHAARVRAYGLGRAQSANSSALYAPSPKDGEVRRTALPDTFDGIRFEIGRMVKYVQDSREDPVMLEHCRTLCRDFLPMAEEWADRQGRKLDGPKAMLEAAEAWCREHYVYVNDPPNIEVIQTPRRMVKWTKIPAEVLNHVLEPFYGAMRAAVPSFYAEGYRPPAITPGDCDEGSTLMLAHCVCIPVCMAGLSVGGRRLDADLGPVRFRFGGNDGTLHHVWAYVRCGEKWFDCDLTEPGYGLGDHSRFEAYEEVEVEL